MIPGFVWRVPARVARVIDADSVILRDLDLGFWHGHAALEGQEERVRILDLWSPERYTVVGRAATAYAKTLLPVDLDVIYHSIVWKRSLERVIGSIEIPGDPPIDFATAMIAAGHGFAEKP